jgi:hypothetical protein
MTYAHTPPPPFARSFTHAHPVAKFAFGKIFDNDEQADEDDICSPRPLWEACTDVNPVIQQLRSDIRFSPGGQRLYKWPTICCLLPLQLKG